jgi:dipeptidyl-peptidase-4
MRLLHNPGERYTAYISLKKSTMAGDALAILIAVQDLIVERVEAGISGLPLLHRKSRARTGRRRAFNFLLAMAAFLVACAPELKAQQLTETLDAMFNRHAFDTKSFGPARWIDGGAAYTTVEPSPAYPKSDARDIVRYDSATGERTVLVSASRLIPAAGAKPLSIEDYAWSGDHQLLLVYTNSKKVWRLNGRGDYWVLELATGKLRKLGGDAPASSLMFAQFAPDGRSVAYVRDRNLYVEDLASGTVRALTSDGSATRINGTSDWVSEEELGIRNGFRWSPNSRSIAYWQFDTTGVGMYTLINDTESDYPAITQYPYPQPGTANSAVRVGVVDVGAVGAKTGPTRWMNVPGDPHDHYIARMDWAGNSREVALECLNRLQNDNQVLLADAGTGAVQKLFEDTDATWVTVVDSFGWVDGGKSLLWLSERSGWRQAYKVSRPGGKVQQLTTAAADVIKETAVDEKNGWLYYLASPANATEKYLYRVKLDGSGAAERVTPQDEAGTHSYDISPDGQWAFHTWSTFDRPPVTDLVRLSDHTPVRVLESNRELAEKAKALIAAPVEFFHVKVAGGVELDGSMIRPPDFDPAKKYPVLVYVYGEPAGLVPSRHRPRGVSCGQLRQPRDARGEGPCLAQDCLWRGRRSVLGATDRSHPRVGPGARVRRLFAHGDLGLERRGIEHAEPHVPIAGRVRRGYGGRSGGRPALLRHHLPGTVHGPAEGQPQGLSRRLADQLRGGPSGASLDRAWLGRRQRPLQGDRVAHQPVDRTRQTLRLHGLPQPHPCHPRGRGHILSCV